MSALIDLDRKLTRAAERGKGIHLTPEMLDTIISLGIIECISEAKAALLKEHARRRQSLKAASTSADRFGSILSVGETESPRAAISTSGGTTKSADASAGRRRAQLTFE